MIPIVVAVTKISGKSWRWVMHRRWRIVWVGECTNREGRTMASPHKSQLKYLLSRYALYHGVKIYSNSGKTRMWFPFLHSPKEHMYMPSFSYAFSVSQSLITAFTTKLLVKLIFIVFWIMNMKKIKVGSDLGFNSTDHWKYNSFSPFTFTHGIEKKISIPCIDNNNHSTEVKVWHYFKWYFN